MTWSHSVPKQLMIDARIDIAGLIKKIIEGVKAVKPKRSRSTGEIDRRYLPSWYTDDMVGLYVERAALFTSTVSEYVARAAARYAAWCEEARWLPGLYLLSTKLFPMSAVPAVVAKPPQITSPETWDPARVIKPSSYIAFAFLPVRGRGDVVAKYFASQFFPVIQVQTPRLRELLPQVARVYERSLATYLAKGDPERKAKVKAIKDAIRVWIGSAWLVWAWAAWSAGALKRPPLPYHLAKEPELHVGYMVDPAELLSYRGPITKSDIAEATWRWLLEAASKA